MNYNLRNATADALRVELAIILQACHITASGYALPWSDYERLHDAHQFVLRVLAALDGREVLT